VAAIAHSWDAPCERAIRMSALFGLMRHAQPAHSVHDLCLFTNSWQRTSPFASSTVLAWDPDVMSHNQPANVVDYMTHVRIDGASVHFDDHYVT
jgi:hypothetical protein